MPRSSSCACAGTPVQTLLPRPDRDDGRTRRLTRTEHNLALGPALRSRVRESRSASHARSADRGAWMRHDVMTTHVPVQNEAVTLSQDGKRSFARPEITNKTPNRGATTVRSVTSSVHGREYHRGSRLRSCGTAVRRCASTYDTRHRSRRIRQDASRQN
jgi:hypothetical protein